MPITKETPPPLVPCRSCNKLKPRSEVATRFQQYGHWGIRFKQCDECREKAVKLARKKYWERNKNVR